MPKIQLSRAVLHYESFGEGPALLCVMGFGAPLEGFDLQVRALAKKRRVITFDNRGIGRSSTPKLPWSISDFTRDSIELLDHLKIDCADVLGVSMGGMIAQNLAVVAPGRVRTLILAATFAYADNVLRRKVAAMTANSIRIWARRGFGGRKAFEKALRASWEGKVISDAPVDDDGMAILNHGWRLRDEIRGSDLGVLGQLAALLAYDGRKELSSISIPTLVLAGSADELSPLRQARLLARLIPGAKLQILAGAPHGMNFVAAKVFNATTESFLERHSPISRVA